MSWLDDDPALARCSILALVVGAVGNAYLLLGLFSPAAFSIAALAFPLVAAAALAAIVVIGVREIFAGLIGSKFQVPGSKYEEPAADLEPGTWNLELCCALAALLLVAALAVLASVPPIARDELTHHLALPALYVDAGRIVEVPFADQSYYPMLLEMLYTPLLAWLPEQMPKFLHLLFALASAAIVGLAARRQSRAAGALAVCVVLFTPVVALLACTAYVDLGLLFYTAVAIAALLRWWATGATGWLIVSALAAGFSGTSKYNGLVSIALLTTGVLLAPGRRCFAKLAAAGAVYAALAFVPMSPWLAKNYVQTGNPTFPLFRGVFGGREATSGPNVDLLTRRRVLYGESWLDMAAIPVRLFTTGREGDPGRFDGVFTPLMLLGIAAALRRRTPREQRLLLLFAASCFAIAFFQTSLRARYIIAIVPPLALITAPAMLEVARRRQTLGLGLLAAGALFTAFHVSEKWRDIAPLDYLTGRESRESYVARFVPEYPVVDYANQALPDDAGLYLAFLGTRSYYCRRRFTYDYYFSGVTLRQYVESSDDSAQVLARFRGNGITHMIAADELLSRYLLDNLDPPALERWQVFASNHLTRETSAQGVSLYAIN